MMAPTQIALEAGLRQLIGRVVPGATGLTALHALSGGASQETWSFDTHGTEGDVPLVLRRAGAGASLQSSATAGLEVEAALIALVAESGVPVPHVRYVLRPEDALGSGFIMGRIAGETIARKILRDPQFDLIRPKLARQCGAYLARIHGIDRTRLPSLRVAPASVEIAHYFAQYRGYARPRPVFELAFRWLQDNAPATLRHPTLVHGDFRNGNLMIGVDGVTAILDWELAHIGDPMEDLGWICVNSWRFGSIDLPVGGFGTREELFAGYEAGGGGRVDPDCVKFWEVFGSLKWGIMCESMAATYQSGAERSVERAAIGRRGSEVELDLLCLLAPPYRPSR
jgi:aminoglycoside phosphotransferase (APT) family kinase protein